MANIGDLIQGLEEASSEIQEAARFVNNAHDSMEGMGPQLAELTNGSENALVQEAAQRITKIHILLGEAAARLAQLARPRRYSIW